MLNISHNMYDNECSILVTVLPVAMNHYYRTRLVTMQYVSERDTTLHHDVRKSWRARIVLAIAESKEACRRHLIDPIPEVRHFFPNVAKYEEGPEERVTALLVTEKNNVYYRHATRAPCEPGDRAALVFNLDCVDLTEKEVQELFKSAIMLISNS